MDRFIAVVAIFIGLVSASKAHSMSPFDLLGLSKKDYHNVDELKEVLDSELFVAPTKEGVFFSSAQIIILDKRLGKPSAPIKIAVGESISYGNLNLTLQRCWQETDDKWSKDAYSNITVKSPLLKEGETNLWISSKFPGISNLHHERFEILMQKCLATL